MKRHWDIVTINALGLFLGIVLYLCLDRKVEILAASMATSISLSIGIRTYNVEDDKIFMELFQSFNERYDKLNDELSSSGGSLTNGTIVDYLNLCSEEFLWYKKGRIPDDVWIAWRNGMTYQFKRPEVRNVINSEMAFKDSYYGLFDELKLVQ